MHFGEVSWITNQLSTSLGAARGMSEVLLGIPLMLIPRLNSTNVPLAVWLENYVHLFHVAAAHLSYLSIHFLKGGAHQAVLGLPEIEQTTMDVIVGHLKHYIVRLLLW